MSQLFSDWSDFIALLPYEKILYVYKNVGAISDYEEVAYAFKGTPMWKYGDLILTNKRLFHLEYRYEIKKISRKEKLRSLISFVLSLMTFLGYPIIFIYFITSQPPNCTFALLTIVLFIVSILILSAIKVSENKPVGYRRIIFQLPLKRITDIREKSGWLLIDVKYRRKPVLLGFPGSSKKYGMIEKIYVDRDKMRKFIKNISTLIYEVQEYPRETIQYKVVVEFKIDRNGAISVKCPYCGASAPLQSKESTVKCPYCGKQYIIPQKILQLLK